VTEAIALLALIWAIAATLFAARLAYKLGRTINGWAATLIELAAANEREAGLHGVIEQWETAYIELGQRAAGQPVPRSSPVTPPRDLLN
jgi:hypothetical protein